MEDTEFVFVRIDNRLIHGQVGMTWCAMYGPDEIIVCDDLVAHDVSQQTLMLMAVKVSHANINFLTLQETMNYIKHNQGKILLVVRTPSDLRKLIEDGVSLHEVNVGNMHFSMGKHQLSKKVYVDKQDMEDFNFIKEKGIHIYIQDIPGDAIIEI